MSSAQAATALSYPRAQNFLFAAADDADSWLIPMSSRLAQPWRVILMGSSESQVFGLYKDIKSKDQARISSRLSDSYGDVFDAALKLGVAGRFGNFEQTFSISAAASLFVIDPVFPELSGIVNNEYALNSRYQFEWEGFWFRPSLTYGLRRVMQRSFSVGQLLDQKPDVALKRVPYRGFADLNFEISKPFAWGDLAVRAQGIPILHQEFLYWQVEGIYRTRNLVEGVKRTWPWRWNAWASVAPARGGDYSIVRSIKLGTMVEFNRYVQADLFFMDKFLPAAILRFGPARYNIELYTFQRSEDDFHLYQSRQFGISLRGAF